MNKLYVILPCYNEEENIRVLMDSWISETDHLQNAGYLLHLLPVDDGSKDSTKSIIQSMEQENENITALLHDTNQGLGKGVQTGLTHFYKVAQEGDYALIMDADNTHDPKYVYSMLEKAQSESLDCVIASRYCKTSRTVGVPALREFLSFGARLYYSMMLHVRNVRDYTCGYRIYRYSIIDRAIAAYGDDFVQERGFSCMMEVLYKIYRIGARFGEVPFELRYDYKRGESKMKVLKTVYESLTVAFNLRVHLC
jgi:dolichol-phosphate mannosyltransferase